MLRSQEELLLELDKTLDQLIENASIACEGDLGLLDSIELNALHKTQESLVARFVHTKESVSSKKAQRHYEQLHTKLEQFNKINTKMMDILAKEMKPRIGRNRKKSKLRQFAKRAL